MWLRKDDPGRELRKLMAAHDINTSELAHMTGLSVATISRLRTGQVTKPTIETARRISNTFNVKIQAIWKSLDY